MYNKHLDTFIKVAETGSFSKAATELFITPSAVIQQINNLEHHLDIKLFNRTTHGITLTPAGQYLLSESILLVQKNTDILNHLSSFKDYNEQVIRVAYSSFYKVHLLYEMFFHFFNDKPNYKIKMHTFQDNESNELKNIDIVETVFYKRTWQKDYTFFKMTEIPISIAVSIQNHLAEKKLLTYDDLKDLKIVVFRKGLDDNMDLLHDDLVSRGFDVITVRNYDSSVAVQCMINNYALVLPSCWKDVYNNLITIPCDWNFSMPYGFFLSKSPTKPAKEFFDFIKQSSHDFNTFF